MESKFYSIKDLCEAVNRTPATLYAFMRSSDEEKRFFAEHRQVRTKGGYVYDEAALSRLKQQYQLVEDGVGIGDNLNAEEAIPIETPSSEEANALREEVARLTAEVEALKGENAALKRDFTKAEGERVELLAREARRNEDFNHLLMLFAQEKAEKQALLPPPRKTIGERIKGLFKRDSK